MREDKVISSNHRFYPDQIVYSKIRPNLAKVVVVDFEGLCSADMYPIDALIDALETQLTASRATAENLLSALVVELTSHD